jgi:hypothetical protein
MVATGRAEVLGVMPLKKPTLLPYQFLIKCLCSIVLLTFYKPLDKGYGHDKTENSNCNYRSSTVVLSI